jgi:hypothetical protein
LRDNKKVMKASGRAQDDREGTRSGSEKNQTTVHIRRDVDYDRLAKQTGDEAYRLAKDLGWPEHKAQKWRQLWSRSIVLNH